jgi:hypothetical protein
MLYCELLLHTNRLAPHFFRRKGAGKDLELKELGPRFDMKLYQIKQGTIEQQVQSPSLPLCQLALTRVGRRLTLSGRTNPT